MRRATQDNNVMKFAFDGDTLNHLEPMPLAWFVYFGNYLFTGSSCGCQFKSLPDVFRDVHVHPRNDTEVFQPVEVLAFRQIHFVKYEFGYKTINLRSNPLRIMTHLSYVDFCFLFRQVKEVGVLPLKFVNDT